MRVLIDVNVLLDVLLSRDPWRVDSGAIWDANRDGRIDGAIAAVSLPTIFYIIRKQIDRTSALLAVKNCLLSFAIVDVDRPTLERAAGMTGSDFEDNLQIACAVVARLDAIVTRDPGGFAGSSVPVLSPADLLARLSQREAP